LTIGVVRKVVKRAMQTKMVKTFAKSRGCENEEKEGEGKRKKGKQKKEAKGCILWC
jgi:hypothetical protein